MDREVGRIVEVRGTSVKAELFELLPPFLLSKGVPVIAPRINTYVKTRVGLDTIVCQITGEYYDEHKLGDFSGYFLDLTVKGYYDGDKFIQGLRLLPIVAANIELLDSEDIKRINTYEDGRCFRIGGDLYDSSQDIYLNYNGVIPSHVGIFGNTGSGKSNTLTKLLHEYSKLLNTQENGKLLIFDINNEYGGDAICELEKKRVYSLSTGIKSDRDKVPLDIDELQEDSWCILLNATEATQRPVIKTAYYDTRGKEQYLDLIKRMIVTGQRYLVKSLQYNMGDYIQGIEKFIWHSTGEIFYCVDEIGNKVWANEEKIVTELDKLDIVVPEDKLDNFLFRLYFATAIHIGYGTQYDFISPLLRRAEKLIADFKKVFDCSKDNIFDKKNIAVIKLANVNKDMSEIIPAILTDHFFREQVNNKNDDQIKNIINIVIDEAHNLLYEDENDIKHTNVTIEIFEKAIKEGRKFGLFLWIASQRPSDISNTIISQMHNYFIHKLVNPYDLNRIRKAVAFLDENAMNALTVLGAGECIISGTGVNMPCFVMADQVEKKYRPNSENVVLLGEKGIFTE